MPSTPAPRQRLVFAAALFAGLLALSGCSGQPQELCAVCGDDFVETASDRGHNVSIQRSELHVAVRTDGSATWTARVRLTGDGVDAFRRNESLRRAVVRTAIDRNQGLLQGTRRDVSSRMDGRLLVVTYETDGVARRNGAVAVVDYFFETGARGHHGYQILGSDRLVLQPPDGWAPATVRSSGTVEGETVVWRRLPSDETYVVLAPDDVASADLVVRAGVARWLVATAPGPLVGTWVAALLFLGGLAALQFRPFSFEGVRGLDHGQHAVRIATVVGTAAGVVAVAAGTLAVGPRLASTAGRLLGTVLALAGSLFVLAGYLDAHGGPARWAPVAVATTLPVALTADVVLAGGGALSTLAWIVIWSVAALVTCWPALVVGRQLGRRASQGGRVDD